MTEKFKALRAAAHPSIDFSLNSEPKCPHCGEDFNIRENEAWELYDENGPHNVECSSCGQEFAVSSHATWQFSTDEQEDDDD